MNLPFTCPVCNTETILDICPPIPAKISGPPENCYPAEGGEFEPDACPHCSTEFDFDKVLDKFAQSYRNDEY